MAFQDPTIGKGRLLSTQILVGAADKLLNLPGPFEISSRLVLRDISDQPLDFQGELTFSGNGSLAKAPIPPTHMAAGEIQCIDLNALKAQAGIADSLVSASVSLQYSGNGGALMGRVYGVSADRSFGFYWALQPFAANSYSESFWTTAGNWIPIITVANFGTADDDVTLELTSNAGTFQLPAFQLSASESRTLNIRDLINSGTVDINGKPFPSGVDFGGYRIYGASRKSKLVIKEQLIDPVAKLSTPFYGEYVYATNYYFVPTNATTWDPYTDAPYTVDVSGNTVGVFTEADYSNGDTGQGACITEYYIYSGSGNIGFTVDCVGVVTGQNVGYATVYATDDWLVNDEYGDEGEGTSNAAAITVTPAIQWNGTYITNTSANTATQSAVIGQQILLNATPSGGSWSVGGNAVAGFNTGSSGGPVPLTATSGATVLFYWALAATNTVTYTISGQSASATFSVAAPSVTVTATNGSDIWLNQSGATVAAACGRSTNGDTCMQLSPTVGSAGGVAGATQWVQVINGITDYVTKPDGSSHTCSVPPPLPALDTSYPYTSSSLFTDSPREIWDVQAVDSFSVTYSFSTVLMWKPSLTNAIPVPLSSTNWGWAATVTFSYANDTWSLSSPTYPTAQVLYGAYWPVWYSTFLTGSSLSCN